MELKVTCPMQVTSFWRMGYSAFVKVFVPVCLIVYFLVSFARIRTTDIVPFSAWALFVFVPNHPEVFTLKFDSAEGKPLNPPVPFDAGVFGNPHDITAYYILNHFGMAWEKGDAKETLRFRILVEKNVLPPKPLSWYLVKITYDPLERWRTGIVSEKTLAHFSSGGNRD